MPFFKNTEILRRDVQVLDHILTMEIKTHFILNLQRPTNTTENAWATKPPKTVGIYRGRGGRRLPTAGKSKKREIHRETTYCRVYITYVIIRNVFKTIYDV